MRRWKIVLIIMTLVLSILFALNPKSGKSYETRTFTLTESIGNHMSASMEYDKEQSYGKVMIYRNRLFGRSLHMNVEVLDSDGLIGLSVNGKGTVYMSMNAEGITRCAYRTETWSKDYVLNPYKPFVLTIDAGTEGDTYVTFYDEFGNVVPIRNQIAYGDFDF